MTSVDVGAAAVTVVVGSWRAVVVIVELEAGIAVVDGDAAPVVGDSSSTVVLVATSPSSGGSPKIAPRTMNAVTTATAACAALGQDRYRLHPEATARLNQSIWNGLPGEPHIVLCWLRSDPRPRAGECSGQYRAPEWCRSRAVAQASEGPGPVPAPERGVLARHPLGEVRTYDRRMDLSSLGRAILVVGLGLAAVGLALVVAGALGLGRLPGDLSLGKGVRVYVPLATCLLLSAVATVVLNLIFRR